MRWCCVVLLVAGVARADTSLPAAEPGWVGRCKARFVAARTEMARQIKPFAGARIEVSDGGKGATSVSLYLQASDGAWLSAVYTRPWDDPRPDEGWRAFPGNDDRFFRARMYAVGHGYLTAMGPVNPKWIPLFEKRFEAAIDGCVF